MAEVIVNMVPEFRNVASWEDIVGKVATVRGKLEGSDELKEYNGLVVEWDDLPDGSVNLTIQI